MIMLKELLALRGGIKGGGCSPPLGVLREGSEGDDGLAFSGVNPV